MVPRDCRAHVVTPPRRFVALLWQFVTLLYVWFPLRPVYTPDSLRRPPSPRYTLLCFHSFTAPLLQSGLPSIHLSSAAPAARTAAGVQLDVRKGGQKMPTIQLDRNLYYLFGRGKGIVDFVVEHPSASRVHFALIHDGVCSWGSGGRLRPTTIRTRPPGQPFPLHPPLPDHDGRAFEGDPEGSGGLQVTLLAGGFVKQGHASGESVRPVGLPADMTCLACTRS